jgi:uncharacterized DUF497 family protein
MRLGLEILWNEEKNRELQSARDIAFEDVVAAIEEDKILDDLRHPSAKRAHQRILVVEIRGYVCGVPYITDGKAMFLKTVYRSRDLQRKYMGPK